MPVAQSSEILTRAAQFAPSSYSADTHTVNAVWSTGAPVPRFDMEGRYMERLDMAPEAVDLSEFIGGPVLNSHDRFDVRSILGTVESASTDGERGTARLRLNQRACDEGVESDVANGILRSVSVGYTVQKYDTDKAADGTRTKTARRWKPVEVSLVSVPADQGARIRGAGRTEGDAMDTELVTQIRATGALLGIDHAFIEGLTTREGMTLEAARAELFTRLERSAPRIDSRTSVEITRDERDGFIDRVVNVIAHRIAPQKVKLEDAARPLLGRRLMDLGREVCRLNGEYLLGGDNEVYLRWGAMHTTSDFPNLLMQVFNKVLLPVFLLAPSGIKQVTRRATPANDFRLRHIFRNSPMQPLLPLNEHSEIQRTSKADVKAETYQVKPFGAIFGITRQALVNDDLSAFADRAEQLAIQAQEFENSLLAQLLISNPIMSDGQPLFSAAHNNMAASGSAIDSAGLSAGRLAMRLQTNQNPQQPINIRPSFLLTSATNETSAQQALASIYPTQTNFANVFEDFVKLVIDPRLDLLGQTTGWYLFSDTGYAPVLEDSYLTGYEGPRVITRLQPQNGGDFDGVEVVCQLDYGVGCIGWQGAYFNPGA